MEDFIIYVFLSEQDLVYLFVFFSVHFWLGHVGPFLVIRVYLTYCIPSYPKPRTLWIFMYVMVY